MFMLPDQCFSVGYRALVDRYKLPVIPHFRWSYIALRGERRIYKERGQEYHLYRKTYAVKNQDDVLQQIEFALKYDGVNLEILRAVFQHVSIEEVENFVKAYPSGKYARCVWFLFEKLTRKKLKLPDSSSGGYCDLLDDKMYFTSNPINSRRHRVRDNLFGNVDFCPMVRKTDNIKTYENENLSFVAEKVVEKYDPSIISRAMRFLYTKETISSYEIECERPDKKKAARFIELLREVERIPFLNKETLVGLQKVIVDSRFALNAYRTSQNYVGEISNLSTQKVHYISPKPEDVEFFMENFFNMVDRLLESTVPAIVAASIISFAFVFIHPFDDGNGRIHRFLIHHILSKMNFTPKGIIFPVSAVMLKDRVMYDSVLESFSFPLMFCVTDFTLLDDGTLTVHQDTRSYYQNIDMTIMAEYLYSCMKKTIETDFKLELEYLVTYDRLKVLIQDVVDMPNNLIDLFIKCVVQNSGSLSPKKRKKYFYMLTDNEVQKLEFLVKKNVS
jgi:hypothetical protein